MSRRPFLILIRTPAARGALFLLAALIGALLAYTGARLDELHSERLQLRSHAEHLLGVGLGLANEIFHSIDAVNADKFPACSPQDIAFLRSLIFHSAHIRDAGRIREGKVICDAGVGRLDAPLSTPPPDVTVNGTHLWISARLMISADIRAFVLESRGVAVAINPATFTALDEGFPTQASGFFYDRKNNRMVRSSGEVAPLSVGEMTGGRFVEKNGIFYQPACALNSVICTVGYERRADFETRTRSRRLSRAAVGALLGGLLALAAVMLDLRRRSMESQLRRAIRHGDLTLLYQPIVDLATGVITGAEALVRWTDEDDEFIGPDIFIALAESRNFVCEITGLVMKRVVQELGDLLVHGRLRVTINITSQDLEDPTFLRNLNLCMDTAHIDHATIGLELTERSTAIHGLSTVALDQLKQAGYQLYIDDFGTGYSSLAYLHRLSVNAIKIDRAFTQTIGTEAVTASVVPQILEMARQLDLHVVVEGIETEQQAEYFRRTLPGIEGQGWLYSKPLPAQELRQLLEASAA